MSLPYTTSIEVKDNKTGHKIVISKSSNDPNFPVVIQFHVFDKDIPYEKPKEIRLNRAQAIRLSCCISTALGG